jgi:hypothetical protein
MQSKMASFPFFCAQTLTESISTNVDCRDVASPEKDCVPSIPSIRLNSKHQKKKRHPKNSNDDALTNITPQSD